MAVAIGPSPLEFILLMLFGGGFGLPSAREDPLAAKVAPAECVFYLSWAATAAPDAASGNHTEKLLAEPEVQEFLKNSGKRLLDTIKRATARDPQIQQTLEDVQKLWKLVQGKPGAIFLSDIRLHGNDPPEITGGGLLRVDGDAAPIKNLLEKFQAQAPKDQVTAVQVAGRTFWRVQLDPDAPSITWGISGKYLIVGIGEGSAEKLMQRARGQAPDWLTQVRAKLPVPRPASVMYTNVEKIVQLSSEANGSPRTDQIVSALGLDKIRALASVHGLDEKGFVSRTLLTVDGAGSGLLSWIDAKPLAVDDVKIIGRDAPAAVVLKLDLAAVMDLWFNLLRVIDPRDAERAAEGLAQFEQQIGFQLRNDLLKSFGDTWRIFAQPGPNGMMTWWTVAIGVRDRQKLEIIQDKLIALMTETLEQAGPGAPSIHSNDVNGKKVHTLDFGQAGFPISPSWCVTDRDLLFALTPQSLKPLLAADGGKPSLAGRPEIKVLLEGGNRMLALAYIDMREVAHTLIALVPIGLQALKNMTGGMPVSWDLSHLPSAEAVLPHLQPTVAALRRTADGIELESHQTLPGGNLAATAPVAIALLLPAVSSAREAARRTHSANHLKQFALAMHNYHDANNAFPAGYNADEQGKPLLSWRVHILPNLEQQGLYDRFHLDEPWDSPHNKKLIARMPPTYRSPGSNAKPGMTNYLGVSGADGVFVRPQPGNVLGTSFRDLRDGTANTIMMVEVSDKLAVIWSKPGDFAPDKKDPKRGLLGMRVGGFYAGFADGSVRFMAEKTDAKVLQAYFTKSGVK